MQIGDLIRRAARRFSDAPAVVHGDAVMTFREFDTATDRVGHNLLKAGAQPGDRVGLLLPNGIHALVAYYALAKAGLVRVSLNTRDTRAEHAERLRDAETRFLITDGAAMSEVETTFGAEDLARMMRDGPDEPCDVAREAESLYRLGYTGGTTGRSKGVMLSLRSEYAEIASYLIDLMPDVETGETMLHAAPVTHASGSFFLPTLMRGACNVVLSRFDPGDYLDVLLRTRATRTFLVPTMMAMLLDEPNVADAKSAALKGLYYGASPISPSVAAGSREVFGDVLCQTYGQSEAPMALTLLRADEHDRVGSAGRPYTLAEVRIFDDEDRELPAGAVGEVVARGPIVMSGYWRQPDKTARTLRGGWLHTGDIGHVDDDGFLYLLDRRNDVIISGGYNVYPREVEDLLQSHPRVREAAVVGIPDDTWGEVVHAVVTTNGAVSEAELSDFVRGRIAGYKRPKRIEVWPELPKSSAGKLLRRAVRERARAVPPASPRREDRREAERE